MPISSTISLSAVSTKLFKNIGRVAIAQNPQTITLSNPHSSTDYIVVVWRDDESPFSANTIKETQVTRISSDQFSLSISIGGLGYTAGGSAGPPVGTTERFDDVANTHTSRANISARYAPIGWAMPNSSNMWFGYTSCGSEGSDPGVGLTQRFDDITNSHTNRASATARYALAGYAMPDASNAWFGYTSGGWTTGPVGTTERFDDVANSHTGRTSIPIRYGPAGYAMPNTSGVWFGFTSCGYAGSLPGVGTTQKFDDVTNTHTSRADAVARYTLAGYAMPNSAGAWFGYNTGGYTGSYTGYTERFDDSSNSYTTRASITARRNIAGYAMSNSSGAYYGFTSCGWTGSSPGVSTTEKFDDVSNVQSSRANATARSSPAGFALPVSVYVNYATLE